MEVTNVQVLDANSSPLLDEWREINAQLKDLREREVELRFKLIKEAFSEQQVRDNNLTHRNGMFRLTKRKNFKVSDTKLAKKLEADLSLELFNWKPNVNTKVYNDLDAEALLEAARVISWSWGLPALYLKETGDDENN